MILRDAEDSVPYNTTPLGIKRCDILKENQLLRDPHIEPTPKIIAEGLGAANGAYLAFLERLPHHGIEQNWRFYTDGNAWLAKGLYAWTTMRGTQKETTAFWLSIWEGFFRTTIFVPEKHRAAAANLSVDAALIQRIESTETMGKLKFFPLVFDMDSDKMFDDVLTLIDFRKALK